MKNIFLLIDGETKCTLYDFIEINKDDGFGGLDKEDVAAIEKLSVGEIHQIPQCTGGHLEVKRVTK